MKRYYCENCGNEVQEPDELCRHCGAIFVAIKCPQCGYRGKEHHFRKGCPVCGFLGDESPVTYTVSTAGTAPSGTSRQGLRSRTKRYAREKKPWPDWLFWVALAVLILSFVILSWIYLQI